MHSPIQYLGQIQPPVAKIIFDLIGTGKKYSYFYDLCAGSASMTLLAIENNLADSYVINDAYPPLSDLWRQIYYYPNQLIAEYKNLLTQLKKKKNFIEETMFVKQVQQAFNHSRTPQPAHFAFLLNYTKDGMVYFSNGKLQCEFSPAEDFFAERVMKTHALFHTPTINLQFTSQSFIEFKNRITANDFVFLDPPFPDSLDASESPEKYIYYRTHTKREFTGVLTDMLSALNTINSDYICIYGLYSENDSYKLESAGAHLVCPVELTNNPLGKLGVNFYVAKKLANSLNTWSRC
jgi:site-specific DNA-adenine methylase